MYKKYGKNKQKLQDSEGGEGRGYHCLTLVGAAKVKVKVTLNFLNGTL